MAGKSIHIGLNHVDPGCYDGWDGELAGCINDANSMLGIASSLGYDTMILTDGEATSNRVLQEISQAAGQLGSGDILLLTYSGHGGQVHDANGDEDDDAMDETWVLYDREVVDDELYALWSQFAAGVRICVLSDSCHSGTVAKMMRIREFDGARSKDGRPVAPPRSKNMPAETAARVAVRDRAMYDTVQYIAGKSESQQIAASVLLISGCQDNQLSYDGAANGAFTGAVLQAWSNGAFQGNYSQFHQAIVAQLPPNQTPNYFKVGTTSPAFEQQKPFTIAAPAGTGVGATQPSAGTTQRPELSIGDQGPDVRHLQERLVQCGHVVAIDGFFGRQTDIAVRAFQASRGLSPDGIVGSATWQALESSAVPAVVVPPLGGMAPGTRPRLQRGSKGPDVQYLQQCLIDRGYQLTADGIFGGQTESAVRAFQRANGLTADGIVGQKTWQALETRAHPFAHAMMGRARDYGRTHA